MTSLVLTITETLRYRGKIGQWAWVLHRVSGMGTLIFLIMHVIDTSWATFYPELYAKAIAAYKTPLFTVGEFVLVACVVYHALNGFRIALFDYRPQWWRRQADAAKLVLLGTLVLLVPVFFVMAGHVVNYYNERVTTFDLGLESVIEATAPFAVGTVVVLGLAFIVSAGMAVVPSLNAPKKRLKGSKMETFMWSFMRISGVLIIPLVFGHLAMMHVIQGVFDLTKVGHVPVFTNLGANVESTLTAVNFVRLRWDTMLAGVYIWRIYDILLLVLVTVHGFNGARYVINDYIHNKLANRALRLAAVGTMIGVLWVGALAILQSVPATTAEMLNQSSQVIGVDADTDALVR
ncbi:MAG: succinate dehydrogenase, cytochrome b556 subunit [Chloroflexi bacterium CFX4]|nr:succinate dehydrogenase, cytochrome b556 subunit [Chloroflexi bacterium CFX4]MDL1923104.1 succinate dehydrogenase, cytochrome b556 subunit [Chloroflexi bacterium CFX3]